MIKHETLKNTIAELVQTELNNAYTEITKDTVKMFKVETNWFYDGNNFGQYDEETGRVVLDEYNEKIKYIPVAIQSIIGERVEVPNIYINDVIVPISLLIFDIEKLDTIELVLSSFSDKNVGKVHNLKVLVGDNKYENYKFSFTVDLPDFDEFQTFQGENSKAVVFQLSGTLTQGSIKYGNDISYFLSIDNGNTYEELIKISPSNARKFNTSSDQKISDYNNKAIEESTIWTMNISAIAFDDNNISKLLPFVDERDYNKLGYEEDYLNQLKLKIVHNIGNKKIEIVKDVLIETMAYDSGYGDFLVLSLSFIDKLIDDEIPLI